MSLHSLLAMLPPSIVDAASLLLAAPVAAAGAYLGGLALMARGGRPPAPGRATRFDVIVPAHNEALSIEATVRSLLALDYPRDRFRVVVVADNCSDDTAARARAAGATVLERVDPTLRGKGYALALAYETSMAEKFADAVVVVDADTTVTPNLLGAFAARFEAGEESVQASYLVRNVTASWRTRLMAVALGMYHTLRSLGRERLRLSAGLRGNGMGFSHALLARVPHQAYSIVEDVEYGVSLGLAGVRVAYVHEANVLGEMPETGAQARSQRERWEGGRGSLASQHVPTLLREGLRRRDRVLLDLAADLLVPPLVTLVLWAGLGAAAAAALVFAGYATPVALALWAVALVGLALYVVVGSALSGSGPRVVLDLAAAPLYIAWKVMLRLRPTRRDPAEWVRTRRAAEQ